MSLQVWLPLNGNLNNQGLSEVTVTNSGATVDSSGKIGSCYKCGVMYANDFTLNIEEFSVCYWVKYIQIDPHNSYVVSLNNSTSSDYQFMVGSLGNGTDNSATSTYLRINAASSGTIPIPVGEWHHCCATWKGTTVSLYVDGVFDKKITGVKVNPGATHLGINCRSNSTSGSGVSNTGSSELYLNDVRIYDHCLSAKEVKEISKGLICHYLMNQPEQSPNLSTLPSYIPDFPDGGGTSVFSSSTDGVSRRLTCTTSGTGGRYNSCFSNSERLENTTYTWSIDIRASKSMLVSIGLEGGGEANFNVTTDWQRISKTAVLSTNTYSAFIIYPGNAAVTGDWIEVKLLKVEKNNFATSWSPCSSDYPKWPDNIEYDCSGYRYDGTISELLSYASGSPRYDGCYYFNSASKRITLPSIPMSGFSNSFSISWWGKAPSYSSLMYWGFSDGNRLNFYSGIYCNTGDGSSNPYYKPNTTTTISTPSVDTWHHFVMVGDGSSNKIYMDGELYGVAKTYKGITGSVIVINGWDSSTSYKTNGYISDFRIYSTALSASDIKELYNTSASVDKNGNMYAYEFKEE